MTRIVLILLLLSVAAFAAPQPYYDYFPVYVFGDAESVAEVFNINAMLFQERSTGSFFWWLLILSFVILMFRAAWKIKESDWQSASKEAVWMFFLLFIVLAPIATIKIEDKRFEGPYMSTSGSSYIKVVDNVPYALAWIASGASVTKYYILTLTNNILGTSGDYSTVQNRGFGRSYDDIKSILESSENLNSMRNQDASNFIVNLNAYLSECALPSLYTTPGNREKVMNPDASYMDTLAPSSLGIASGSDTMNSGGSCLHFWNTQVVALSDEYLAHTQEMAGRVYGADSNATALNAAFSNPAGMAKFFDSAALSSIGGMQSAMREASISAAIRKTVMDNSALAGFDAATAANMERSKQSMLQDGVSSFAWMQEMLPMLQHWIMILVILLYFPMVMVALFRPVMGGMMSLISYAGGFFLFEMTDVSFEVVQYLTNLWGGKEALEIYTVSNSGQYFSVTNLASTIDYMATMSGVSAVFGLMSMGLISTIVIKGQVGNLAALSGNLKGMMKGDVLNSGGQEFSTDMAAREHEEAQNRMRKDKMDELSKNGYDTGGSSFETDKLYAQMQSEMAGASKGAAMHHAVADGHGDEVARSAGYKAESGMQAEIAYAEVLESNAGGASAALKTAATSGEMSGTAEAATTFGKVLEMERLGGSTEGGLEKLEKASRMAGRAQVASELAKTDILYNDDFTKDKKAGERMYADSAYMLSFAKETDTLAQGMETAKIYGHRGNKKGHVFKSTRPVANSNEPIEEMNTNEKTAAINILSEAKKDIGVKEIKGAKDNEKVVGYHSTTSLNAKDDETPWCSSFVNDKVQKAGLKGTNSAAASSWATWGKAVDPQVGAVAVKSRKGGNHVGIVQKVEGNDLWLLGGNQGSKGEVSVKKYKTSDFFAFRAPTENEGVPSLSSPPKKSKHLASTSDDIPDGALDTSANNTDIKKQEKPVSKKSNTTTDTNNTLIEDPSAPIRPVSMAEAASIKAKKSLQENLAVSASNINSWSTDRGTFGRNAFVAETKKVEGAAAGISTQGGMDGAIATGVNSAADKAALEQAAFQGQMVQRGVAAGMDPNDAKKLAKELSSSGARVAEMIKSGMISAGQSAAKVSGAEKEGQMQSHTQKLRNEFGETLTEKKSSISEKTYAEERATQAKEEDKTKQKAWDTKKANLEKEKSFVDAAGGDNKDAAILPVKNTMEQVIANEPSYDRVGKMRANQSKEQILSDISSGKEVTTKDIKRAFGDDVGSKMIQGMENNGVSFSDASGIGTGDAIDVDKTAGTVKKAVAGNYVLNALGDQKAKNQKLLKDDDISKDEFDRREKAIDYLSMGARGKNGGSMPFSDFKKAGFSQESLTELGIKDAGTTSADMTNRMFQISHIDHGAVLKSKSASLSKDIQKEMPQEMPQEKKAEDTPSPSLKKKPTTNSWNALTDAHTGKKVDEFVGAGAGIINNTNGHEDIYTQNALYGEQSKALATDAKIATQGGVDKAVNLDVMESSMKAASQKGATEEQAKQLAESKGHSGEAAEKIVEGMNKAGETVSKMIASGITGAASSLATAQSGAKTRGDLHQVEGAGGTENFIEAAGIEGTKKGVTSKVQNIDVGDPEIAKRQVQGILSVTKAKDRGAVLESMKNFGMVTENSTLDNITATSGEKFLKGKAAAAAATMSKDDRLSFGGYSYNLATDSTTGDTKVEASDTEGLSTGRYVHDKTGVRVDNPVQMVGKAATGLDPTDTYLGNSESVENGDYGDAGGGGSAFGTGVIAVATITTAVGGYKVADNLSGKKISGAASALKHKVQGDIGGKDAHGNTVYSSKEKWESLENDGFATKGTDGKWETSLNGKELKEKFNNQKSLSADVENQSQTANKTRPITTPVDTDANVNMKTPLNSDTDSIPQNAEKPHPVQMEKKFFGSKPVNTVADAQARKETIGNMSKEDVGKKDMHAQIQEQRIGATPEQNIALNKMENAMASGKDITPKMIKAAGFADGNFLMKSGKPFDITDKKTGEKKTITPETVDFGKNGARAKSNAKNTLNDFIDDHKQYEESNAKTAEQKTDAPDEPKGGDAPKGDADSGKNPPPSDNRTDFEKRHNLGGNPPPESGDSKVQTDAPKAKTKWGQVVAWATGALAIGGTSASAAGFMPPMSGTKGVDAEDSVPMNTADTAGLAMQGSFNALNAVQAGVEMKTGASTKIKDLAKVKSYVEGGKDIADDFMDTKSIKAIGGETLEKGVVAGGKQLGKAALKKLPVVGLAMGAGMAVSRAEDGDYVGAAMEFASGALSMVPGVGTAASVAVDTALMKRDYDKAQESSVDTEQGAEADSRNSNTPSIKKPLGFKKISEELNTSSNTMAGEQLLRTVTPSANADRVVSKANNGVLTRDDMVDNGVPQEIADATPVDTQGFIDVSKTGALYKDGVNALGGVVGAKDASINRLGNGVLNSIQSSSLSQSAALSIANSEAENYNIGENGINNALQAVEKTQDHKLAGDIVRRKLSKGEPITRDELVSAGAPVNEVETLPVNNDGSINVGKLGEEISFADNTTNGVKIPQTQSVASAQSATPSEPSAAKTEDQKTENTTQTSEFKTSETQTTQTPTQPAPPVKTAAPKTEATKETEEQKPETVASTTSVGIPEAQAEQPQSVVPGRAEAPKTVTPREAESQRVETATPTSDVVIPEAQTVHTQTPQTQSVASAQSATPSEPVAATMPSEDAVDSFMGTMNTATSRQIGATALAMSAPEGSQQQVFELAMNSGNISPMALDNMGLDPSMVEQMKSQFSTDGNTIDVSNLGSAMQANAAANFTNTKLGTASVDNSDLLNAITSSGAGDHNLDNLEAIIEQRAGSNGVTMKTADGEVNISRDRNDNLTVGGEPTNANYQEFRENLANSSPIEQSQMASSIAQSSASDVFERLDGNDREAWKNDGGYMLDMARDTRTGNEDARSGFIDISFALEEQTEMFQETLQNAMEGK